MRRILNFLLKALAAAAASIPTAAAADCFNSFCEQQLTTDGYVLRYKLNEPDNTITMELTNTVGDVWLGIAVSETGSMDGSEAVIGSSTSTPQKYRLKNGWIEPMSPEEQTLIDASCEFKDGQTVMKFTKALKEDNQLEISMGDNTFLWAYGYAPTIDYHGPNKSSFTLTLEAKEFTTAFPSVSPPTASSEVDTTSSEVDASSTSTSSTELTVGDDVCITGYIMDTYCIELGHLLDDKNTITLKEPENHSFHCLLDVPICYNSGFNVLGEKDPKTGMHCLGFRLDDKDAVLAAGRAAGSSFDSATHFPCSTCSGGESKPVAGYKATVKGTVKELGDGTESVNGQPLLTNFQLLDANVTCDSPAPQTVCMTMDDVAQLPEPVPPPTADPEPPVANAEGCPLDFCVSLTEGLQLAYTVNEADGTITMEVTHDEDTWIGIGFSLDDRMAGSVSRSSY